MLYLNTSGHVFLSSAFTFNENSITCQKKICVDQYFPELLILFSKLCCTTKTMFVVVWFDLGCHIVSFHSKFGIGVLLFVNRSLSGSGMT